MMYKMKNEKLMEKNKKTKTKQKKLAIKKQFKNEQADSNSEEESMFERLGHTRKQRTIFGVHQQHSKNRGSREKHT